jgi:hypothetical protein
MSYLAKPLKTLFDACHCFEFAGRGLAALIFLTALRTSSESNTSAGICHGAHVTT